MKPTFGWLGTKHRSGESRGHFFTAAAEAMHRILVEKARRKQRLKHGGGFRRVTLDNANLFVEESSNNLIVLDEALAKLSKKDKMRADLVKLRFLAGLTGEQTAKILGISHNTSDRYWAYACSWLHLEVTKADQATGG